MSIKSIAKYISLLALGFVFVASTAYAAIGFDQSEGNQNVNLTNVNLSVTVTSTQSNLLLVFKVFGEKSTALNVSGITYNGVALTKLYATTTPTTNSSTWQIWYLVNPATGTHNSTTTFSTTASSYGICAESYYGVNQTTPFDTSNGAYVNATTTVSTTLTTTLANEWITSFAGDNGPAGSGIVNPAPGSGDTSSCSFNTGGLHFGAAYRSIPTAQTTSTQWIQGTSTWYGMAAGAIEPTSPAVAPNNQIAGNVQITGNVVIQ